MVLNIARNDLDKFEIFICTCVYPLLVLFYVQSTYLSFKDNGWLFNLLCHVNNYNNTFLFPHKKNKQARLYWTITWSVSYVKPNGILRYQSDAAHKLFNQIDRYITNWVGYCHPSSIFPWSRSLRKILYGWWVCGEMKHPDLRHDHLSILWQLRSPISNSISAVMVGKEMLVCWF